MDEVEQGEQQRVAAARVDGQDGALQDLADLRRRQRLWPAPLDQLVRLVEQLHARPLVQVEPRAQAQHLRQGETNSPQHNGKQKRRPYEIDVVVPQLHLLPLFKLDPLALHCLATSVVRRLIKQRRPNLTIRQFPALPRTFSSGLRRISS